jgi:hypothetical protein
MSNPSNKGEEILYGGFLFQSQLKVRWAVFFDALNIEYRYQSEEHTLEGIRILPDFYLLNWESYVVITEDISGKEVKHRTGLLALYTGKPVYTIAGQPTLLNDIFLSNGILPDLRLNSHEIYCADPPRIITYPEEEYPASDQTKKVETLQIVKVLLHKLSDCHIEVSGNGYQICFFSSRFIRPSEISEEIQRYVSVLQKQQDVFAQFAPLLVKYVREIIRAVTPNEGWVCEFIPQFQTRGYRWAECSVCGDLAIMMRMKDNEYTHGDCLPGKKGIYRYDSPRLTAAYMKASP